MTPDLPLLGYFTTSAYASAHAQSIRAFQAAMTEAQTRAAARGQIQSMLSSAAGVSPQDAPLIALGTYPTFFSVGQVQHVADLMFEAGMLSYHARRAETGPPAVAGPPRAAARELRRSRATTRPGDPAMATQTCPACASEVKEADLICFTCGANLPRTAAADNDPPAPVTVMQEYLRAETPRRVISPAVLRLTFPTGNVEVPAGTSLLLGRDPADSLVAAAFASYDNVSRRHATVIVDDSGRATIRDEHSTNGTFVNGDRVLPGTGVRLADGDIVRLGGDASAEVSLPRQQADPATF